MPNSSPNFNHDVNDVAHAKAAEIRHVSNWSKITDHAEWQERDSMGGLVFKGRLWILGGWFNSGESCPRDVWCSPDGRYWQMVQLEAPWRHSDFPTCLVFRDRMWVMGGWYNGRLPGFEAGNEVWSSGDGEEWERSPGVTPWSPRVGAAGVVFNDKMWILGGVEKYFGGDETHLRSDVWRSSDGNTWELATENPGWNPRAFHQAVVFKNKMWVIGGGNYTPGYKVFDDVWCSDDGVKWELVAESVPCAARLWFSSVVYRDRIWVMGGWSNDPFQDFNDVWHSADGKNWEQLESDVVWSKRHAQAAYVFKDKIWIAGGHARPLSNEVWSLDIPQ